uniref:Uncharacterized protein n=1 Tax=Populus trichocarpa TaxID=3694 RepID=U5G5A2_POPTR
MQIYSSFFLFLTKALIVYASKHFSICLRQGQAEDCKHMIWVCTLYSIFAFISLHSFEEDFSTAISRRSLLA